MSVTGLGLIVSDDSVLKIQASAETMASPALSNTPAFTEAVYQIFAVKAELGLKLNKLPTQLFVPVGLLLTIKLDWTLT